VFTPRQNQLNIQTVSDLTLDSPTKQWNSILIDNIFIPSEGSLIKQTPLIMEPIEDQLMWPHSKEGTYTVKSGYNLLKHWADSESPSPANTNSQQDLWKKLWNLNTIPRHKALLWRIIQKAIPVKSSLAKRGINCNILCPRCLQHEETIEHAFMHCERASRIWFGSNLNIQFNSSLNSFSEWLIYAIRTLKEEQLINISSLIYNIWYARNQHAFNQKDIDVMESISKENSNIHDYIAATTNNSQSQINTGGRSSNRQHHSTSVYSNRNRLWNKPEEGYIKINSDANLSRPGRWGLGATCRDADGALIAAATWEMPGPDDATMAEAYALYQAVHLARDCCFQRVLFESDNSRTISLINSEGANPRNYLGNVIMGIQCIMNQFRSCRFYHINRLANRAAHEMAKLAHDKPNMVWIEEDPPQLIPTLVKDLIHQF
jgi:hypothetical protein